ncbi:sensor histidine kinase [Uliginosibacterium gangwonense]|uniref:sensor histidine kinase n=1 Tax=Uliginosibacterium gangwonense TaxID=392736 RepID=UPI000377EC16|nr:sensor histidine kinase [Uliginosibacterium gangwonense]
MLTLRRLLVLGFSLLALLPLAAGSLAIWYLLMPGLQAQAIENSTILATTLVNQVSHFFDMPKDLLLAGAHVLEDKSIPNRQIDDVLGLITRANNVISATYLTDAQRRITHVALEPSSSLDSHDLVGLDLSAQHPFTGSHDKGVLRWSDVFLSALSTEPTIVASIDLDQRTLAGEISLKHLSSFVHWAAVRNDMQVIITDARGQVLAHPDPEVARSFANLSHLALLQRAQASGKASDIFELHGERYIGTAMLIKPQNWMVIVAQPLETALKPGWKTLRVIGWLGLAVLFMTLSIGYFMARWLAMRTEAVAHAAMNAAESHEEVNWPNIAITEYAQLVTSLRSLIQTIRAREQELLEANTTLEDKVVQRTTALTHANEQLATVVSDLTHTRTHLDRTERLAALGRLVAGVAHELNTPIGNCLVVAGTMQASTQAFMAVPPESMRRSTLQEYQEQILEASALLIRNLERAAKLIQSFKQVSTDQQSAQRRTFDLADILDEVRTLLTPLLKEHEITLNIDIPLGIIMDSYPNALSQVISNLIENAVIHAYKDRPEGIIQITCERGKGGYLQLSVTDHGCGIAKELLPQIFEPFFKTRFGQGGTGLGLHISYQVMTGLLGGTITVDSTPGSGSCFMLDLPQKAPAPAQD